MKVLLYGGTFDPPHNGHLNNLRAAAARVMPDLTVVMPAGVPPHKAASATPAALRLEMCRCFAALEGEPGLARIEVSDWEIGQAASGRRNYTVLTLEMLARRWPGATLYLAVGSDMLETFREWYRWQDILRLARLVVVSREIGDDSALHAAARSLDPAGSHIQTVDMRGSHTCRNEGNRVRKRHGLLAGFLPGAENHFPLQGNGNSGRCRKNEIALFPMFVEQAEIAFRNRRRTQLQQDSLGTPSGRHYKDHVDELGFPRGLRHDASAVENGQEASFDNKAALHLHGSGNQALRGVERVQKPKQDLSSRTRKQPRQDGCYFFTDAGTQSRSKAQYMGRNVKCANGLPAKNNR